MRSDALLRRETILRTARELFAEHGTNIAMETIAEASHVGIGTLYRNFAGRPELIEEVTVRTLNDIKHAADATCEGLPGNTEAWFEFLNTLVQLNLGALSEALGASLPTKISHRILAVQLQSAQAVTEVVELAKDAGLVRPDLTAVELVTGIGAVTRPLPRSFKQQTPRVEERLVQFMLDGFKAPHDPHHQTS